METRAAVFNYLNTTEISNFDEKQLNTLVKSTLFSPEIAKDVNKILELLKEKIQDYGYSTPAMTRENLIDLASGNWAIKKALAPLDRKIYLEAKQSMEFKWLDNQPIIGPDLITANPSSVERQEQIQETIHSLVETLLKRYGIKTLVLNSFDPPEEIAKKLQSYLYVFEQLAQKLNMDPFYIGNNELTLSIGVDNDDCNGWLMYDDGPPPRREIILTKRANESILIHEWMHYFDNTVQFNPIFLNLLPAWQELRTTLSEDKFEHNELNMKLFENFSPDSFVNRFITNHVRPEYREDFSHELYNFHMALNEFMYSANEPEASKNQMIQSFEEIKIKQTDFIKKFNNDKCFPHPQFLHRYMSFLLADFEIMNAVIQEKIEPTKSVFNYHSAIADNNFGHFYSGSATELMARSFEAYMEDKCQVDLPLESTTTLWYPVHLERASINKKWQTFIEIIPQFLDKYKHPSAQQLKCMPTPKTQKIADIKCENEEDSSMTRGLHHKINKFRKPKPYSHSPTPSYNTLAPIQK